MTALVKYRTVPEQKNKPVPDEQTLAKLLEAAYVLQEHNREMKERERLGMKRDRVEADPASAIEIPQARSAVLLARPDNTSTLAKIVETQHQIQVRRMDLESTLKLLAQRAFELTNATGAAIGTIERNGVRYRAVAGAGTPQLESVVALDKAMLAPCLKSGQMFHSADAGTEHLLDAAECRRRGIRSLIAVPVFHDGEIAGGLELYSAAPNAFTEEDIHTAQLTAGLVTEALLREGEARSKRSLASERAAMLEALEKLQPNLAALVDAPAVKRATTPEPLPTAARYSCRKCGHQLVADEQFCGQCGSPRAADYEPPNIQSKVASLWHMQESQRKAAGSDSVKNTFKKTADDAEDLHQESPIVRFLKQQIPEPFTSPDLEATQEESNRFEMPAPLESQEINQLDNFEQEEVGTREDDGGIYDKTAESSEALAKTQLANPSHWSSAASARAFLEQFASTKRGGALLQFWNAHRGDIYLGVAVVLVACVVRWGLWSHSVNATAKPATASATHSKTAPNAGLSLFERMLIQLGLAEAPDPIPDKGNPGVQVWVDTRTALYYCPGNDLYGKTPKGKFTTQREAQLDQFEPASRKTCN